MYIQANNSVNWQGSPRFQRRKLFVEETRIKRKPPREETEDTPGFLCWGVVGALPSAEPVPMTGFVVEDHKEISRETEQVRVENPDDPEQFVMVDQTKKMTLEKTVPAEKQNSATKDADLSGVDDDKRGALREKGADAGGSTTIRYTVAYNPPERAV